MCKWHTRACVQMALVEARSLNIISILDAEEVISLLAF